jgi:protein-disulfide isomerase/peroxiredoxin/uncharacterized membrane protein
MTPRTPWFAAVAALLAVGIGVALYLTRLHLQLFYGMEAGGALCDLGGNFSCSAVNASAESEQFGLPQSLLAIPAYLVMGGLAFQAWRKQSSPALGALFGASLLTVLYSARLAWVSATVVGAWCLFCIVLYVVNVALAGLSAAAGGARGLQELLKAPAVAGLAIVAYALVLGGSWGGYEQVRSGMAATAAASAVATTAPASPPAKGAANAAAPGDKAADGTLEVKKVRVAQAHAPVPIPDGAPTLGPANAKVTLVEFSDFQCPFCKRLAGTLRQLAEEYPKDLRIAYVQFPLNLDCNHTELKKSMHPEACHTAAAGYCAQQQGKFWEMHDALFDEQANTARKHFVELAGQLGMNTGTFEACLDDPATNDAIGKQTEAGTPLKVNGTPTFFVNGRQLSGAQPIEVLRAVVDAELAGNADLLDLEVQVGTEETGTVATTGSSVPIAALGSSYQIDAFEASLDGKKAVSKPGVEAARGLSWYDAKAACDAAGKRLCTEDEWLAACTGTKPVDADGTGIFSDDPITGRKYGYGDDRRSGNCADSRNPDNPGAVVTGNHPKCGTPDGVYDLVGNVKEWVGLTPGSAGVKGGSYSSGESARCGYFRDDIAPETKDAATGFRCCSGPTDPIEERPGRDVGEKLAAFDLPLLDGGHLTTKSFAGKPTILTFWASWCGPCKKELPVLASLYAKYKDQGLNIVAISVDSDDAKLAAYLKASPLPFPVARDPNGVLLAEFSHRGVPASFWVKRDGTVRLRTIGLPPGADKRLDELVQELLAPAP